MGAFLLTKHCLLLALLIVAAYTDLSRGKVYNWCTYLAIGLGLGLGHILDAYRPGGHAYLINSILGIVMALLVFALPYFLGWIGGGDVKLFAAIGALAGASVGGHYFVLYAAVYSAVVGAVIAIGVLIWRGRLWEGLKGSVRVLVTLRRRKPEAQGEGEEPADDLKDLTIPYGFAIATGTMIAWFQFLLYGLLATPRV